MTSGSITCVFPVPGMPKISKHSPVHNPPFSMLSKLKIHILRIMHTGTELQKIHDFQSKGVSHPHAPSMVPPQNAHDGTQVILRNIFKSVSHNRLKEDGGGDNGDDNDDHDGEWTQRDDCPKVDTNSSQRDSEWEQLMMTYGKLSNQCLSVKSRLNDSCSSSAQQLLGQMSGLIIAKSIISLKQLIGDPLANKVSPWPC